MLRFRGKLGTVVLTLALIQKIRVAYVTCLLRSLLIGCLLSFYLPIGNDYKRATIHTLELRTTSLPLPGGFTGLARVAATVDCDFAIFSARSDS